jgi:hypothetical protein
MAAYVATQTNQLIGTLTNGVKLCMSSYTIAGVGEDAQSAYIPQLQRIYAAMPCESSSTVAGIGAWTYHATLRNGITYTPAASNDGNVFKILWFGF